MDSALEKQKQYQRDNGNNCSICHNNNWHSECSACGWWGYVKPEFKKLSVGGKLMNELELLKHAAKWAANHVPDDCITSFGDWISGQIALDSEYVELSDWGILWSRFLDFKNAGGK